MIVQALRERRRMKTTMISQKGRTQGRVAATLRKHNWTEKYLMGTENVATDELFMGCENKFVFLCLSGKKENG